VTPFLACRNDRLSLALALTAITGLGVSAGAAAGTASATAKAEVIPAIGIANNAPLEFGGVVSGSAGGTVTG
jgi:hypothetical protein